MAESQTQPYAQAQRGPMTTGGEEWGEEIGSGDLITWGEPKVLIGTLVAYELVPGTKYGTKPRATLVLDDGSRVATFPPAMLASRLEQVPLNTRIRIEYDGTTSKSKAGQDVKQFSVRASTVPSLERLAVGIPT